MCINIIPQNLKPNEFTKENLVGLLKLRDWNMAISIFKIGLWSLCLRIFHHTMFGYTAENKGRNMNTWISMWFQITQITTYNFILRGITLKFFNMLLTLKVKICDLNS